MNFVVEVKLKNVGSDAVAEDSIPVATVGIIMIPRPKPFSISIGAKASK